MSSKLATVFLLVIMFLAAAGGKAYGQVYLTLEEALDLAFPHADSIVKKKVWLDQKARAEIGNVANQRIDDLYFLFYVGMKDGEPVGYMVVDDVIGRTEPITYMVVFTPEGMVERVEVMVYREPQGGEVRYRAFMKQFEGKSVTDPPRVGADIRVISGATMSTFSITAGVKKLMAVFQYNFLKKVSP
jgi:Na+-translocating ferredoxin:NAD+ oxidoreductase RnfG subunit